MNESEVREKILSALGSIAPEADLSQLNPSSRIRDQLDLDSMDFLNFLIAINKELHVDIPERDYGQMATLNGCVQYVTAALLQKGHS